MHAYITDHQLSQIVCRHAAQGSGAGLVPPPRLREGPAIVYGLLRGCGEVVKACQYVGRDFWHIDNGYFRPRHNRDVMSGYYRVTLNAFQQAPRESPPDRWEDLDTVLRPWRREGRFVLVVPPSQFVAAWFGIDLPWWTSQVLSEIALHTGREVRLKPEKGSMSEALENCWCVVTYNSMAAVHALREGIPCITLSPEHVARPVSWAFEDIESPWWPEREPWAWGVAYQQFTLDEMARGLPWT